MGAAVQAELARRGWVSSPDQIQFRNTVLLDLRPRARPTCWRRMKQKTRYNLRLAERKGVTVRAGTRGRPGLALPAVRRDLAARWLRDSRAGLLSRGLGALYAAPGWRSRCIAEVEGEPVSALVVFRFGRHGLVHVRHEPRRPPR